MVSQERSTGDALLPFPGIGARFLFVFVANTVNDKSQEYLTGRAYIIDKPAWQRAKAQVKVYESCLRTARKEILSGSIASLESIITRPEEVCLQFLDSIAAFSVDARICRTGTTDISCRPNLTASIAKPVLPTDEYKRSKMLRAISSQLFFFLKDIGHHHQHHEKTTDTITDLYLVSGLDESNLTWRAQTLFSIYRKIIEYKRQPDQRIFYDCLGLLAYAKTFREISKEELPENLRDLLPVYYSEAVAQSIEATQAKNERETEERRYYEDRRTNNFIGCFGLLIAYIGLMQFANVPRIEPNHLLQIFISKLLKFPIPFLVFFFSIIYKDYLLKWMRFDIGVKLLRLLSPLRREWALFVFILLIGACLSGILALVFSF